MFLLRIHLHISKDTRSYGETASQYVVIYVVIEQSGAMRKEKRPPARGLPNPPGLSAP